MLVNDHVVIFSHGFGVKKDSRGLFSDIAESLTDVQSVLFDYNDIDEAHRTLTVPPFSVQAVKLRRVIDETREQNPEVIIDLVCHSQGCLIPALLKPKGTRRTIMLAPSLSSDMERAINYFRNRPGSEIDFNGISKLSRRDGSTTLVLAEFWPERRSVDPIALYNEFAKHTQLTIVIANQDEVLGEETSVDLDPSIKVIRCDGNHDFNGKARPVGPDCKGSADTIGISCCIYGMVCQKGRINRIINLKCNNI